MDAEDAAPWLDRLQAIGRAQARYLWVLLVVAIFYAALASRPISGPPTATNTLTVPFVELDISAGVVLASAPLVLSFLVTVIMGALRAYGRATDQLKLPRVGGAGEAFDHHPNALDLAVYTTPDTNKHLAAVFFFAYPIFLGIVLLEAVWIATKALGAGIGAAGVVMVAIAAAPWVAGVVQVWNAVRWRWTQVRAGTHVRRRDPGAGM